MHLLKKLSRRNLLGAGAAAAGVAPFLPLLESHAGDGGVPTRVIVMYTPAGTHLPSWRPTGTELDWQLSPILAPLQDRKDDVIVLDGIDDEAAHHIDFHPQGWGYGGHHAICSLFTGQTPLKPGEDHYASAGISLDQFLGEQLAGSTPFRTLQFGVDHREEDYWKHRISFTGPQAPVPAVNDPELMLEQIFGQLDLDEAAAERLKASRLSVIDAVKGELDALALKTSKSDKVKVERHLDGLRELELSIRNAVSCEPPEPTPLLGGPGHINQDINMTNMLDLLVTSLTCDATRVATFMFSWENSGVRFPWLDLGVEDQRLHGLSHEESLEGTTAFAGIQSWFAGQFKELLDRLDNVPQPDGQTLLDHTVVLWASPTSVSYKHSSRNIPVVIGGRGGGYFETGRYLKFGDFPATPDSSNAHLPHGGRTMNDLMLSIVHAMGFGEFETFGDPAFCTGPLL